MITYHNVYVCRVIMCYNPNLCGCVIMTHQGITLRLHSVIFMICNPGKWIMRDYVDVDVDVDMGLSMMLILMLVCKCQRLVCMCDV